MEYQDKLNILETVLNKYGLSLQDEEVYDFFYKDRRCFSQIEYNDEGKKYTYSSLVKPATKNICPLDFENSGYFTEYRTLIDWFMYENSSSNPLVWNNIGNPTFDVLDSFQRTRDFMGPVKQSLDGKLCNGEDANHRLLTLIINQFIETKTAKLEEQEEVKEKYTMPLEVSQPINYELHKLLDYETEKFRIGSCIESIFPNIAREFRAQTFEHYREAFYCAKYNEETKTFNYDFNGEVFSGTEQELIDWLKIKKQQTEPIMTWEAEGTYYVSCYNKVYKSKSKEKMLELIPKVKQGYLEDKIKYGDFLEIKDVDANLYEIQFPSNYIEDKEEAKYFADAIKYFLTEKREIFLNKLQSLNFTLDSLEDNVEKAFGFWGGYSMPNLIYKNLTKEEYKKLQPIMFELAQAMEYAQNPELSKI